MAVHWGTAVWKVVLPRPAQKLYLYRGRGWSWFPQILWIFGYSLVLELVISLYILVCAIPSWKLLNCRNSWKPQHFRNITSTTARKVVENVNVGPTRQDQLLYTPMVPKEWVYILVRAIPSWKLLNCRKSWKPQHFSEHHFYDCAWSGRKCDCRAH